MPAETPRIVNFSWTYNQNRAWDSKFGSSPMEKCRRLQPILRRVLGKRTHRQLVHGRNSASPCRHLARSRQLFRRPGHPLPDFDPYVHRRPPNPGANACGARMACSGLCTSTIHEPAMHSFVSREHAFQRRGRRVSRLARSWPRAGSPSLGRRPLSGLAESPIARTSFFATLNTS